MQRLSFVVCAFAILMMSPAGAQSPATVRSAAVPGRSTAAQALPVRRVVLYKNGIGYFEHVGHIRGTQTVAVDFTSAQLNDVLKSLTTIDLGGGQISGISYNSEASLSQRLGELRLPLGDRPTLEQLLEALRGATLEVRDGGRAASGRLLGVEKRVYGRGENTITRDELTLVGDAGDIHTIALTPTVTIRMAEHDTAEQIGTYLGLLSSTRAEDRRRLTIRSVGTGDRDLLVSYISEVPIWKATYRIVLPDSPGGKPILQGWAIVDNTVGSDWTDVQLSLVAGAPQSFIQQLSQPLYGRRPLVPLPRTALLEPQTHESALTDTARPAAQAVPRDDEPQLPRQARAAGDVEGGVGSGTGGGVVGGMVGGLADSIAAPANKVAVLTPAADVRDLGDLFEYRLTKPVTIRRNQSALVPILSAPVGVERVSLWNGRTGPRPLRSVWLTNTSALTLDAGSFAVIDARAFAGEGLMESLKPGEKRLLSYAVDLGVRVDARSGRESGAVRHLTIAHGVVIEHSERQAEQTYTLRNDDATSRTVIVEHARRSGWTIVSDVKPSETTSTAYRFTVPVAANTTATLVVDERSPNASQFAVLEFADRLDVLMTGVIDQEGARRAFAPILAKKTAMATIEADLAARQRDLTRVTQDQQRIRENMKALKGTREEQQLLRRYASDLNQQEDRITAVKKTLDDLERQHQQALSDLNAAVEALATDIALR